MQPFVTLCVLCTQATAPHTRPNSLSSLRHPGLRGEGAGRACGAADQKYRNVLYLHCVTKSSLRHCGESLSSRPLDRASTSLPRPKTRMVGTSPAMTNSRDAPHE